MEDLGLLIIKNHLPMHLVENQWLNKFSLHLCRGLFYLLGNSLQKKFCCSWWKKLNNGVLPTLVDHYFVIISFDLWMSKEACDIFTFHINFLGVDW